MDKKTEVAALKIYGQLLAEETLSAGCVDVYEASEDVQRAVIDMIVKNDSPSVQQLFNVLDAMHCCSEPTWKAVLALVKQVATRYRNLACS